MSDGELPPGATGDGAADGDNEADRAPRSINLWVVYGLMLLAALIAVGLATLIVLPFYHRR